MTLGDEILGIPVDGEQIVGTLVAPQAQPGPLPGVLFVHGWGGGREQYLGRARAIAGLGCICLTFDLRGHAETQPQRETVTREQGLQDVLAAYDMLASRQSVDRLAIALVGSSYGAYLGAIATGLRPVRFLALRAPALYKDADWELPKRKLHLDPDFAAYRRRAHQPIDNRALCACAEFRGDVLVVESERDEVIPRPTVKNYLAALTNSRSLTYRLLDGADHGLSDARCRQVYTDLLVSWLQEMTASVREPRLAPGSSVRTPTES